MRKYKTYLPLLLLLFFITCSDDTNSLPQKDRGEIIENTEGGRISKSQVIEYVTELSAKDIANYDVDYYAITYRTQYKGKPINSRGLLLLPVNAPSPKLIAYFHGTQIPLQINLFEKEIPSNYDGGGKHFKEIRNMGLTWASAGYAVFMPDYIGYGITSKEEHPYVYYPEMFESNIDGILSAQAFLHEKGYADDKDLFLTGWSQGAGASLSAHKYIQEKYATDINVIASSGLAGPYNFSGFLDDVFNRKSEEVPIAGIASWGLYSLNKFSGIKRPTDQIWSYLVFDQMSSILTPSNVPEKFLKSYFLNGLMDSSDTVMRNAFDNNSFHKGWKPHGKVFLHHGDADNVVPYFNSVDAEKGLSEAGGDVKFYTYPDGKHDTELGNYITNTLNDFNTLK